MIRQSVDPIRCWLDAEYLYDMAVAPGDSQRRATIIGISSYPGSVLTFDVLIDECGGLFHYIPISAVSLSENSPRRTVEELAYHDCPSGRFEVTTIDYLKLVRKCWAYKGDQKEEASYVFTVDWYENNLLLHVITLQDGRFAAWPSHKISFLKKPPEKLPDYKKLRKDFSVGRIK